MKTDKVIYRTRTLEEYDWLMDKLEEVGCEWLGGCPYDDDEEWILGIPDYCIWVQKKGISYSNVKFFYDNYKGSQDHEIIEVSDLMETEIEYTIKVCFE